MNVNHIKMIRLFFKVFCAVSIVDVKFAQSLMSKENPSSIFRLPLFFIDNFCVQYFPLSSSHDSRFVLFCLCNIGALSTKQYGLCVISPLLLLVVVDIPRNDDPRLYFKYTKLSKFQATFSSPIPLRIAVE